MFGQEHHQETDMKTQLPKLFMILLAIIFIIFCLGWLDWRTGYELNFFVFYFIPVGITAWLYGIELSILISVLCTFVWAYADRLSGHGYSSYYFSVWNPLIRLMSFLFAGYATSKIFILLKSEKIKTKSLEKALSEIKVLESFLSICCVCKKIRNEDGSWQQLESYISENSSTEFSHSYCPECAKKAMEEAGLTIR